MIINESGILTGLGILGTTAVFLSVFKKRFLRYFSVSLLAFIVIELVVAYFPLEDFGLLWLLHMPSILLLGVDEIFERHGWLVSTIAHAADLLLWSFLAAVTLFFHQK